MIQATRGPKNILAWNEEMNRVPPWSLSRITVPSINNVSPDGSLTASIIHEDATAANTHFLGNSVPLHEYSRIYTVSAALKTINRQWASFYIPTPIVPVAGYTYLDTINGVFGNIAGLVLKYSVDSLGNGWFKFSITYQCVSTIANAFIRFAVASANGVVTFDGLNQDSIYIWRPQLTYGYYPDDTFKTAEVPVT